MDALFDVSPFHHKKQEREQNLSIEETQGFLNGIGFIYVVPLTFYLLLLLLE